MKHKHYDCIVAWANGADIEYRIDDDDKWEVIKSPNWFDCCQYRIKKEPVIVVKYFRLEPREKLYFYEFEPDLEKWHLKITYQDGVAIKAEVAE